MATQQLHPAPRREALTGGALDAETRQQVAELNQRVIGALLEMLAAAPAGLHSAGVAGRPTRGPGSGSACRREPPVPAPGASGAAASPASEDVNLPGAVLSSRSRWLGLDPPARQRLADCPYLLVSLDVAALVGVARDGRSVALAEIARGASSTAAGARSSASVPSAAPAPWCEPSRLVLQYAWHLARVSPVLASFVLALPAADVGTLRSLSLARADALAVGAADWLRLRWPDDAAFWSDWLDAASADSAEALWSCQRRGLQRLAGTLRPRAATP